MSEIFCPICGANTHSEDRQCQRCRTPYSIVAWTGGPARTLEFLEPLARVIVDAMVVSLLAEPLARMIKERARTVVRRVPRGASREAILDRARDKLETEGVSPDIQIVVLDAIREALDSPDHQS